MQLNTIFEFIKCLEKIGPYEVRFIFSKNNNDCFFQMLCSCSYFSGFHYYYYSANQMKA